MFSGLAVQRRERSVPSSGSDLLDSGSDGLCPLASWTGSHGAGVRTLSASDPAGLRP